LLHPLPLNDGGFAEIQVAPLGPRIFQLAPWPFAAKEVIFHFPARHVSGRAFNTSAQLEETFHAAAVENSVVKLLA
jgi:hypothetical protein